MSFAIPTLKDLVERSRSAFRTYLPGTDAWLWPNNINPTAKVIGGAMYELHQRLAYVERQKFATTADGEWLDRHASEIGLARRPAAQAVGAVTFTSSGALSVVAGAVLARADGGTVIVAEAGSLLSAGTLTLAANASAAGKDGTTIEGTPLTATSGVTGTATIAVAAGGISGGADLEADDDLRARVLFRKRNPPNGGSAADYVQWLSAIPGVTRVFVERLFGGPGTVRAFVMTDDATTNGIPTAGFVADAQLTLSTLAPAGALAVVATPVAQPIDITITGLSPSTTAVREAVLAELRDTFRRLSRVAGSDTGHPSMPYLATAYSFSRSWIWQAIANATGEDRHVVTTPAADVTVTTGSIPVLGTVTFA